MQRDKQTNNIKCNARIWICKRQKQLDIRGNNHNKWTNQDELEKKLEQEFENYLKEN